MLETIKKPQVTHKKFYSAKDLVGKKVCIKKSGVEVFLRTSFFLNEVFKGKVINNPYGSGLKNGRETFFDKKEIISFIADDGSKVILQ